MEGVGQLKALAFGRHDARSRQLLDSFHFAIEPNLPEARSRRCRFLPLPAHLPRPPVPWRVHGRGGCINLECSVKREATGITIGVLIGVTVGAFLDNIAMGIVLGLALGIAVGPAIKSRK